MLELYKGPFFWVTIVSHLVASQIYSIVNVDKIAREKYMEEVNIFVDQKNKNSVDQSPNGRLRRANSRGGSRRQGLGGRVGRRPQRDRRVPRYGNA